MNRSRRARTALPCLMLGLTLVAGACKGPVAPLDIGSKDVPLDMLIGAKRAVAGAPLPPVLFGTDAQGMPTFGRVTRLTETEYFGPAPEPRKVRPPATTLPPGVCPELDPFAVPRHVAMNWNPMNPKEGTYTYRTKGTFEVGGISPQKVTLPTTATMKVFNSVFDTSKFPAIESRWQVAVTLGEVTTTTSYKATLIGTEIVQRNNLNTDPEDNYRESVDEKAGGGGYITDGNPKVSIPKTGVDAPPYPKEAAEGENAANNAARPNQGIPAGLYITKIENSAGLVPFEPAAPGLLLAKFPITLGDSFDSVGSDGLTTMSFRSFIEKKATVNACGTPIDTWTIALEGGKIVSAATAEVTNFAARYQLGTQYGNLIVADNTAVSGSQAGASILRLIDMTINQEPKT